VNIEPLCQLMSKDAMSCVRVETTFGAVMDVMVL